MSTFNKHFVGLTRYPLGSIRELLMVALPLMLMGASGCLMHFLDRIILARYSLEAMNIAVVASMPIMTLQFGLIAIASIAEVFVGQYNGSGCKEKLGEPVWQMIYFACMVACITWPMAYYGTPWLLPTYYADVGSEYLSILMYGVPLSVWIAALACFFIGQGKVLAVTLITLLGNALNAGFAYVFVFGIEGYLAPMGLIGAAWGLNLCLLIEAIFLMILFQRPLYRKYYGSASFAFKKSLFLDCLKIGIPSSLGHLVELVGWSLIVYMVAEVSVLHATLWNSCHILWVLFSFLIEGLNKGVIALSANALGAHQFQLIPKIYRSALIVNTAIFMVLLGIMSVMADLFVFLLLGDIIQPDLAYMLKVGLQLVLIGLLFDGIAWVNAGVITAAKDTQFVMLAGICNTWFFAVLPIYYFVVQKEGMPLLINMICIGFSLMNALIYTLRYRKRRWELKEALI